MEFFTLYPGLSQISMSLVRHLHILSHRELEIPISMEILNQPHPLGATHFALLCATLKEEITSFP